MRVTVYLVRRLGWEYGDDFYHRSESADAPLRSFLDQAKAEAYRRELEWNHIREHGVNPFGYIDAALEARTSLPPEQLYDRLRRAGMAFDPARPEHSDLWRQYDAMPDEGRRQVWDVIDRIRFYELVEMAVDLEG
ncbi:MAG: hypothetical protein ACRC33_17095 [Gemmataceae bacterium]